MSPFAETYRDARAAFLEAAGRAGAAIASLRAPGRGPAGEPLFTDVAGLGDPEAPVRLVVSSGLHGVEGFCGSACQIAWLRSGAPAALAENVGVILVHALNPFGFAWVRRFDDGNVDLNRNFLDDFADPPQNPRYREIRAALAAAPGTPAWRDAEAALAAYRAQAGEAAFHEAATGGQYEDPQGIFYGGAAPAWTRRTFVGLLRERLAGAERAVVLDIHTGIGAFGERVPFLMAPADDPRRAAAERLFGEPVRTPARGPDGARVRRGLMLPHLDELGLAPAFLPLGVEFGTLPLEETTKAVRAENWLFHHGRRDTPEGRRIVQALREAFCPTDADWEAAVLAKSAEMFRRIVAGLRDGGF